MACDLAKLIRYIEDTHGNSKFSKELSAILTEVENGSVNPRYQKESTAKPIVEDKALYVKLRTNLKKLYPKVDLQEVRKVYDNDGVEVLGKMFDDIIQIGENAKIDTLPHEYAHYYISMFKNTPIVKTAIKKWGSEEALVQAIGEQAVKQKGEVYGWWKKFGNWLHSLVNGLDSQTKEEIKDLLTDSLLTNDNLNRRRDASEKTKGEKTRARRKKIVDKNRRAKALKALDILGKKIDKEGLAVYRGLINFTPVKREDGVWELVNSKGEKYYERYSNETAEYSTKAKATADIEKAKIKGKKGTKIWHTRRRLAESKYETELRDLAYDIDVKLPYDYTAYDGIYKNKDFNPNKMTKEDYFEQNFNYRGQPDGFEDNSYRASEARYRAKLTAKYPDLIKKYKNKFDNFDAIYTVLSIYDNSAPKYVDEIHGYGKGNDLHKYGTAEEYVQYVLDDYNMVYNHFTTKVFDEYKKEKASRHKSLGSYLYLTNRNGVNWAQYIKNHNSYQPLFMLPFAVQAKNPLADEILKLRLKEEQAGNIPQGEYGEISFFNNPDYYDSMEKFVDAGYDVVINSSNNSANDANEVVVLDAETLRLGSVEDIAKFKNRDNELTLGSEAIQEDLTLDSKNKTLLAPVGNIDIDELDSDFTPKKEHHLTVLGFPQGKQLKKIIEANPEKEAEIQALIDDADFSYALTKDVYKIQRDMDVWVDWKDQSKGKKKQHDEAIIVKVNAPGVETFINELNGLLDTSFPIPFAHISLATKGSPMGIGVANEAAFNKLKPEKVELTLGSEEEATNSTSTFNKESSELKVNALKSVEGMKAIIEELNDHNVTPQYKKQMLALLDRIDPEFIPNVDLYMNTQADKNAGMINATEIIINTNPTELINTAEMSATEVYVHELMHAITKYAIVHKNKSPETKNLVRQVYKLRRQAMENTTWRDLLPKESLDFKKEEVLAKKRWDYIFNGKNSLHEFIAHGMTNPRLIQKLSRIQTVDESDLSLFGAIKRTALKLLDYILGTRNFTTDAGNIRHELTQLTFELMKANNKAVNAVGKQKTLLTHLSTIINTIGNEPLSKFITYIGNKIESDEANLPKLPNNPTRADHIIYAMKILPRIFLDEKFRHLREGGLKALGMKPEGFVQNIIRDFQTPDELERAIEHLGLQSDRLDAARESTVKSTKDEIANAFNRTLSNVEKEALTLSIVDLDLGVIYDNYKKTLMINILSDRAALEKQISSVTTQLKRVDPRNFHWNNEQSKGLGYYLATHNAGLAQNLNAHNIARGVLTKNRRKPNAEVTRLVDELSTLVGIKYTSQDSNQIIADLMVGEKEGIDYVVELNEGIKKESEEKLFTTKAQLIKGYSKELFDPTIAVEIKPIDNEYEMNQRGFELVRPLIPSKHDKTKIKMGIYKNKYYVNTAYNRTATRMTDMVKKGTSVTDSLMMEHDAHMTLRAKAEIARIKVEAVKVAESMENGTYKVDPTESLAPVLDQYGNVTGFRYMMNKSTKKELFKQDTQAPEVLGRTLGSINDKLGTAAQNEEVLKLIRSDMTDNYDDDLGLGLKTGMEYIRIERDSNNPTVQEIYKILPSNMKQAIKDSDEGFIAVRRDMLHNYFGFRDGTLTDFFFLYNITPKIIKSWITAAEQIWRDIVSISKVDVIIRTPIVFIGNIVSNFMYSVVMGANPLKVGRLQLESARDLMAYMKGVQELTELRIRKVAGKNVDSAIARVEAEQKANSVHELMEAGMYQAIVEDIDKKDQKSTNRLAQRAKDFSGVKTAPEFIKTGVNWMYLNENTSFFATMTKFTQYSDFIARSTEYKLQRERGIKKEVALNNVLDAFINYGKPASAFEEYLNDMGFVMFTKYAKRIQRVIQKSGKEKPMNILLSALGQELFMGIDDIWDQHPLVRSYTNIGISPLDHIERMATPSLFEAAGIIK